jgi:hypothetical protein
MLLLSSGFISLHEISIFTILTQYNTKNNLQEYFILFKTAGDSGCGTTFSQKH